MVNSNKTIYFVNWKLRPENLLMNVCFYFLFSDIQKLVVWFWNDYIGVYQQYTLNIVKWQNIRDIFKIKIKFNKNKVFALSIEFFNYQSSINSLNEVKNIALCGKID